MITKRRKKPPDLVRSSLISSFRAYHVPMLDLASSPLCNSSQFFELGMFVGIFPFCCHLFQRSSAAVTAPLALCILPWFWVANIPVLDCRHTSGYCSSARRVSVKQISRGFGAKNTVRDVVSTTPVNRQRSDSVRYGNVTLSRSTSTTVVQVWVWNSLPHWVYLPLLIFATPFWWYGWLIHCWNRLFHLFVVSMVNVGSFWGLVWTFWVQLIYDVNWPNLRCVVNTLLLMVLFLWWPGFPLYPASFGLRGGCWGALVYVCVGHSGVTEGNFVFYVLVVFHAVCILASYCVGLFLLWSLPCSPFTLAFGGVPLKWIGNAYLITSLPIIVFGSLALFVAHPPLTIVWIWWQGSCSSTSFTQPLTMRLIFYFCVDQLFYMLRMHLCMLGKPLHGGWTNLCLMKLCSSFSDDWSEFVLYWAFLSYSLSLLLVSKYAQNHVSLHTGFCWLLGYLQKGRDEVKGKWPLVYEELCSKTRISVFLSFFWLSVYLSGCLTSGHPSKIVLKSELCYYVMPFFIGSAEVRFDPCWYWNHPSGLLPLLLVHQHAQIQHPLWLYFCWHLLSNQNAWISLSKFVHSIVSQAVVNCVNKLTIYSICKCQYLSVWIVAQHCNMLGPWLMALGFRCRGFGSPRCTSPPGRRICLRLRRLSGSHSEAWFVNLLGFRSSHHLHTQWPQSAIKAYN